MNGDRRHVESPELSVIGSGPDYTVRLALHRAGAEDLAVDEHGQEVRFSVDPRMAVP